MTITITFIIIMITIIIFAIMMIIVISTIVTLTINNRASRASDVGCRFATKKRSACSDLIQLMCFA